MLLSTTISNQTIVTLLRLKEQTCDTETDDDASNEPLDDSGDDLDEALVDSDNGGQETAPMTGPTSAAPFDGLFHAGLLPALPFGPIPFSELSAIDSSTGEGEDEADDDDKEAAATTGSTTEIDDVAEGDDGTAAIGSDSPRTIWVHGGVPALVARRDWGLLTLSPA